MSENQVIKFSYWWEVHVQHFPVTQNNNYCNSSPNMNSCTLNIIIIILINP